MRFIRRAMLGIALCGLLATGPNAAMAGPPKVDAPTPFAQWLAPLNPTNWRMPDLSRSGEAKKSAPVLQRRSDGVWSSMTGAVERGWRTTRRTLDPGNWTSQRQAGRSQRDVKEQQKQKRGQTQESFWSRWWPARQEPKEIRTANDFLSQPLPY